MSIITEIFWQVGEAVRIIVQGVLGMLLFPVAKLAEFITNRAMTDTLVTPQLSNATMILLFIVSFIVVLALIRYSLRIGIGLAILSLFNSYVIGCIVCVVVARFIFIRIRNRNFSLPFLRQ